MDERNTFAPDWVSAPGETILEILEERGIAPHEFARTINTDVTDVDCLIRGDKAITADLAAKLAEKLGGSTGFWLAREAHYRQDLGRLRHASSESNVASWLSELPTADMVRFGWIEPATRADRATACLRYFGVPNVGAWNEKFNDVVDTVRFKRSQKLTSNPAAVVAWLRRGEIEAAETECASWNKDRFLTELSAIRGLTRTKDPDAFLPKLKEACASCGVALAIVRAPRGCAASGATRFLSPERPLLLLSFRHLSDDHFWFSFFHEAGHLALHGSDRVFVEEGGDSTDKEEREADEFAARFLIPAEYVGEMLSLATDARKIMRFARRIGVSPGIVVGQLQHLGKLRHNQLNNLKQRYRWSV
jgi:Zn-dependent peptidase ImmA (M78 family)/plasmid maintenance system antidote protein VapI